MYSTVSVRWIKDGVAVASLPERFGLSEAETICEALNRALRESRLGCRTLPSDFAGMDLAIIGD